ncbi:tannase and feruloyl esterase [Dichotomopilus funicola]|uniref:Carboxylic ester hydrolase n=1 Tax=Dichotomopilus funicola TaxID=1934379 RepID=A0AAN6UZC8_9PEZI|nr:tannase and feruloyl esterase [Dichotomopilus funicola]
MAAAPCTPSTFTDTISLFGGKVLTTTAALVTNYSASVSALDRYTQPPIEVRDASFCNITVTYTHPNQGDTLIVEAWLPSPAEKWNDRLQAVGGGGWVAGRSVQAYGTMAGAVADGYAAVTTDAGLGSAQDAGPWALRSEGNLDYVALENLGSVSLEDEAIIAKSLIKTYYGRGPAYSYWNGCSQGGRQGLMLAQRYPTAYDGIAAGAPGIQWTDFFPTMFWPQQVMNLLGEYPSPCELQAVTAAVVTACDKLDGVVDGIIADVDKCLTTFDPFSLVGQKLKCNGDQEESEALISEAAAVVANATWKGRRNAQGVQVWPGLDPGTDITAGVATTNCTSGTCVGVPLPIATQWLTLFVARDPDFDLSNLTHGEFDWLAHQGQQRYGSFIGTDDPDLSAFHGAGGKLVTFHGLVDQLLPPKGTVNYYKKVSGVIPEVDDFYRHFEGPGLGHCGIMGTSGLPVGLFDQLRAWVENGTAPDQTRVDITDLEGETQRRILCPYPQKAVFDKDCGATGDEKCWSCGKE